VNAAPSIISRPSVPRTGRYRSCGLRRGSVRLVGLSLGLGPMRGVASMRWSAAREFRERISFGSEFLHERDCPRGRWCSLGRNEQREHRYLRWGPSRGRGGHLDSSGQAMRITAGHLGLGQAQCAEGICVTPTISNPPVLTPVCTGSLQLVNGQCVPALPAGYGSATPTGAIPGNTSGQTGTLPATSQDLCESEGGTWNGSSCDFSAFCSLPLGIYNADTGTCDYTQLYLVAGGAAAFLVLLLVISSSSGSRKRRR